MIVAKKTITNLRKFGSNVKSLLENAALGVNSTQTETWSKSPDDIKRPKATKQRDQSKKSTRPRQDPRATSIVLFPGQGSQYVGMTKSLAHIPEVKDMFAIAKDVLG